ncbi:ATP-dependent RNA helicase [Myotisia sp. PD_48]|nr:ATP-dependent RNA helicase [Myotisia sp. PD_48]
MPQKRARVPQSDKAQQSKRRKANDSSNKEQDSRQLVTNVDDLAWKSVELPGVLEDAEGFYELEEIEGVEILAPPGNGTELKFRASTNSLKKPSVSSDHTEVEQEEWQGFSDSEPELPKTKPSNEIPAQPVKERAKKDKKRTAENKNQITTAKNKIEPSISFTALEDQGGEEVDISAWNAFELHPELQTSLSRLKFSKPTPIQAAAIPEILAGRDVIGKAATGSGKTLAFGIPILQQYLNIYKPESVEDNPDKPTVSSEKKPLALVLSPTRELAHQLVNHLKGLVNAAPNLNANIASVTGGLSVYKQQRLLVNADIIVGTPGRLWDVIGSTPGFIQRLKFIRFLVVDEADRLLGEGHFKEVGDILSAIDRADGQDDAEEDSDDVEEKPESRQTLVFSATFHKGLQEKLARRGGSFRNNLLDAEQSMGYLLKKLRFKDEKPKFVDANPVSQMAERLKEGIVECAAMEKDLYLYAVLLFYPKHRTLIFTNSIASVRRLTQFLQQLSLPASSLHSSMAQKARLRAIERFSLPTSESWSILVATDVASRGLDIQGVDLVLHYHVPRAADAYVHRSGRTARASAVGRSILLCSPEETSGVARLVAQVHNSHSNGSAKQGASKNVSTLQSIHLDRGIISRIRPRTALAKKITESVLAKERMSSENDWLQSAAEELGVEYDSDEFAEAEARTKRRGRGGGKRAREKVAGGVSKAELASLKAQLRDLLSKRVNLGVSERYLTSGRLDVDALLKSDGNPSFLGHVQELGF